MSAKPRTIKITDSDWQQICELAKRAGVTSSKWLLMAATEKAARSNVILSGTGSHGGNRWYQCRRCGGWNVGNAGDGIKRCADCGWSSEGE